MLSKLGDGQLQAAIRHTIVAYKPQFLRVLGSVDAMANDDAVSKAADMLHPLLPLPVRLVIKKDKLENLLKDNRDGIIALLRE